MTPHSLPAPATTLRIAPIVPCPACRRRLVCQAHSDVCSNCEAAVAEIVDTLHARSPRFWPKGCFWCAKPRCKCCQRCGAADRDQCDCL